MLKTIFLIWSFSFAAPRQQPHRFEIKFYNNSDSCVRTVDESGIQTVKWADQTYTIKKDENIPAIRIYNGHIRFFFDGIEVLYIGTFDFYSSFAFPESPYAMTINGRFTFEKYTFSIWRTRHSDALDAFISDQRIRQYLIYQNVDVE